MKRTGVAFGVAVMMIAATALAGAGQPEEYGMTAQKDEAAVSNLMIGLNSENQGLRESAACMLGELKADKAVIPLMSILRSDANESSRVIAALALCRIGDGRGVFAVRRAVTFDPSESVQKKCAWFYEQYVHSGSFEFSYAVQGGMEEVAVR